MPERHSAEVLARFRVPQFALQGAEPGQCIARTGARAAGAEIEIHLAWSDQQTVVARFLAYGDPVALAAADWVCDQVDGRSAPVGELTVPAAAQGLGVSANAEITVALAVGAMNQALADLQQA